MSKSFALVFPSLDSSWATKHRKLLECLFYPSFQRWYIINKSRLYYYIFQRCKIISHPTYFPYYVTLTFLHWEMASLFHPLESKWVCVYSRSDAMWLPRLSDKKSSTFSNSLLSFHRSSPLEFNHHAVRKPSNHKKVMCKYSGNSSSWDPLHQPILSARYVRS